VSTTLPDLGEFLYVGDPSEVWPLGYALKYAWYPLGFAMAGDCGVDLFLVLSGFLLGTMLASEIDGAGRIRMLRFYCRRWFRIVPAFASAIVVSMGVIYNERQPWACPALWCVTPAACYPGATLSQVCSPILVYLSHTRTPPLTQVV
jgi:peptidoglycan/LPS O-acetylase OafA/YrhL